MTFKQKKILILFCGEPAMLGLKTVNQNSLDRWVNNFLELSIVAQTDTKLVWQGMGLDSHWDIWKDIAQEINKNKTKYDGFVVIHSLDNILFASNLISFLLSGFSKPIIFTSSNITTNVKEISKQSGIDFFDDFSDLTVRANLLNALQTACLDVGGVNILTGNLLVQATKAVRNYSDSFNLFIQLDNNSIGQIDVDFNLNKKHKSNKANSNYSDNIETNIDIVESYPNFTYKPNNQTQAIFVKSGMVNPWSQAIEEVVKKFKKPILIHGLLDSKSIKKYQKMGSVIIAKETSYEAALAKYVWALGKTKNIDKLRKIFNQNISGELE